MRPLTLVGALLLLVPAGAIAQVVGGCETPVAARTSEVGCYLVATHALGDFPAADVFWHIYIYPTLAEAKALQTARGPVVQSHGKVWLYHDRGKGLASAVWRTKGGHWAARAQCQDRVYRAIHGSDNSARNEDPGPHPLGARSLVCP